MTNKQYNKEFKVTPAALRQEVAKIKKEMCITNLDTDKKVVE